MRLPRLPLTASPLRAWIAPALAGALALVGLRIWPEAELAVFAQGAARVAGGLIGAPVFPAPSGWMLPMFDGPVMVNAACSATDFFLLAAVFLAQVLVRRRIHAAVSILGGVLLAVPFTLFVNGLRIVAVLQLHRWFLPHLPPAYGAILHLIVGTAVFLPGLILLHLVSERHARIRFFNSSRT
ncbi:MAG: hypothetical protein JNN01_19020 [Opitutaceae bacterium]|nr:hypothetical protein [Opitutaceae bacterium]